jgi:hypothetical protein
MAEAAKAAAPAERVTVPPYPRERIVGRVTTRDEVGYLFDKKSSNKSWCHNIIYGYIVDIEQGVPTPEQALGPVITDSAFYAWPSPISALSADTQI